MLEGMQFTGMSLILILKRENTITSEKASNQFTYDTTQHPSMLNEHNNTMRVEAHLGNNNTRIGCVVFIYGQPEFSQEETLIIAGEKYYYTHVTHSYVWFVSVMLD